MVRDESSLGGGPNSRKSRHRRMTDRGRKATFVNVCFYEGYAVKPIVIRRFNGRVFTVALLG